MVEKKKTNKETNKKIDETAYCYFPLIFRSCGDPLTWRIVPDEPIFMCHTSTTPLPLPIGIPIASQQTTIPVGDLARLVIDVPPKTKLGCGYVSKSLTIVEKYFTQL